MTSRDFLHYGPGRRPLIDVGIGNRWFPGELIAWIRRRGDWSAQVSYAVNGSSCKATVPADRIRSEDPRGGAPDLGDVALAAESRPSS